MTVVDDIHRIHPRSHHWIFVLVREGAGTPPVPRPETPFHIKSVFRQRSHTTPGLIFGGPTRTSICGVTTTVRLPTCPTCPPVSHVSSGMNVVPEVLDPCSISVL